MMDGFYSITFRGAADWGMGMLVLLKGIATGADSGGVLYDGRYEERNDGIEVNLTLTVPPGAMLVQGTPVQSKSYTIPLQASFSKEAIETGQPTLIKMQQGPINVIIRRLRSFG